MQKREEKSNMKINEIRLYKLKIFKNGEVIFEGMAEDLPEDLKLMEVVKIDLIEGEAVIEI